MTEPAQRNQQAFQVQAQFQFEFHFLFAARETRER